MEDKITSAFQKEFVTPNGRLASNTQTAYALALAFGLLPESERAEAAARLAEDVRKFGHLTTGFLGTPLLCQTLSDYGYLDEAYMLLNRKEYPSWLYPVTKGATTIWERWDGHQTGRELSGSVDEFLQSLRVWSDRRLDVPRVAGIELDEHAPGYKHIFIQPHPGGGLTHASASVESMYGRVASGWEIANGKIDRNDSSASEYDGDSALAKCKAGGSERRRQAAGRARGYFTSAAGGRRGDVGSRIGEVCFRKRVSGNEIGTVSALGQRFESFGTVARPKWKGLRA